MQKQKTIVIEGLDAPIVVKELSVKLVRQHIKALKSVTGLTIDALLVEHFDLIQSVLMESTTPPIDVDELAFGDAAILATAFLEVNVDFLAIVGQAIGLAIEHRPAPEQESR